MINITSIYKLSIIILLIFFQYRAFKFEAKIQIGKIQKSNEIIPLVMKTFAILKEELFDNSQINFDNLETKEGMIYMNSFSHSFSSVMKNLKNIQINEIIYQFTSIESNQSVVKRIKNIPNQNISLLIDNKILHNNKGLHVSVYAEQLQGKQFNIYYGFYFYSQIPPEKINFYLYQIYYVPQKEKYMLKSQLIEESIIDNLPVVQQLEEQDLKQTTNKDLSLYSFSFNQFQHSSDSNKNFSTQILTEDDYKIIIKEKQYPNFTFKQNTYLIQCQTYYENVDCLLNETYDSCNSQRTKCQQEKQIPYFIYSNVDVNFHLNTLFIPNIYGIIYIEKIKKQKNFFDKIFEGQIQIKYENNQIDTEFNFFQYMQEISNQKFILRKREIFDMSKYIENYSGVDFDIFFTIQGDLANDETNRVSFTNNFHQSFQEGKKVITQNRLTFIERFGFTIQESEFNFEKQILDEKKFKIKINHIEDQNQSNKILINIILIRSTQNGKDDINLESEQQIIYQDQDILLNEQRSREESDCLLQLIGLNVLSSQLPSSHQVSKTFTDTLQQINQSLLNEQKYLPINPKFDNIKQRLSQWKQQKDKLQEQNQLIKQKEQQITTKSDDSKQNRNKQQITAYDQKLEELQQKTEKQTIYLLHQQFKRKKQNIENIISDSNSLIHELINTDFVLNLNSKEDVNFQNLKNNEQIIPCKVLPNLQQNFDFLLQPKKIFLKFEYESYYSLSSLNKKSFYRYVNYQGQSQIRFREDLSESFQHLINFILQMNLSQKCFIELTGVQQNILEIQLIDENLFDVFNHQIEFNTENSNIINYYGYNEYQSVNCSRNLNSLNTHEIDLNTQKNYQHINVISKREQFLLNQSSFQDEEIIIKNISWSNNTKKWISVQRKKKTMSLIQQLSCSLDFGSISQLLIIVRIFEQTQSLQFMSYHHNKTQLTLYRYLQTYSEKSNENKYEEQYYHQNINSVDDFQDYGFLTYSNNVEIYRNIIIYDKPSFGSTFYMQLSSQQFDKECIIRVNNDNYFIYFLCSNFNPQNILNSFVFVQLFRNENIIRVLINDQKNDQQLLKDEENSATLQYTTQGYSSSDRIILKIEFKDSQLNKKDHYLRNINFLNNKSTVVIKRNKISDLKIGEFVIGENDQNNDKSQLEQKAIQKPLLFQKDQSYSLVLKIYERELLI